MKAGDWVHGIHGDTKITGFVLGIDDDNANVHVTIPSGIGKINTKLCFVWRAYDEVVHPDDLSAMIDLSLLLKDKEWFEHWTNEASKWKPANHILGGD